MESNHSIARVIGEIPLSTKNAKFSAFNRLRERLISCASSDGWREIVGRSARLTRTSGKILVKVLNIPVPAGLGVPKNGRARRSRPLQIAP